LTDRLTVRPMAAWLGLLYCFNKWTIHVRLTDRQTYAKDYTSLKRLINRWLFSVCRVMVRCYTYLSDRPMCHHGSMSLDQVLSMDRWAWTWLAYDLFV